MPRGAPDYGNPDYSFAVTNTDNSEISTYLSHISRLDGLGRVVWIELFDSGLSKWFVRGLSGAVVPYITLANPYSIGVGGSAVLDPVVQNGVADISALMVLPTGGKVGVEFAFFRLGNSSRFECVLGVANSANVVKGVTLRFNAQTENIDLLHGAGSVTLVTPSSVNLMHDRWITGKLTIDTTTQMCGKLLLGGLFYDLTQYPLGVGISALYKTVYSQFVVVGSAGGYVNNTHLGYVIITTDEP